MRRHSADRIKTTLPAGASGRAKDELIILQKKVPGLSSQALERFVLRARRAVGVRKIVHVLVTGGSALRSLNRQFRGKNKTTDVLSFPASSRGAPHNAATAGDIAISADMAVQNALRLGHSPAQEVKILALHGVLHLAGYDHERDNGAMARAEARLRRQLGLPTALIERSKVERTKPDRTSLERSKDSVRGSSRTKLRSRVARRTA